MVCNSSLKWFAPKIYRKTSFLCQISIQKHLRSAFSLSNPLIKAIGDGAGVIFACDTEISSNLRGVNAFYGIELYLAVQEKYCNLNFWASTLSYNVTFHQKWPLKSAIWSYKIKIICLGGLKLNKKVKSNSLSQL